MQIKKKTIAFSAGILLLLAAASWLLEGDFPAFFRWYLVVLFLGIGFYPLTSSIFADFSDGGWVFSKTISLAAGGFLVWFLSDIHIIYFTNRRSWIITLILIGFIWVLLFRKDQKKANLDPDLVLAEEFLFLAVFLFWTYLAGFRPEAHGTEKFMDYGFMAAMDRSCVVPALDMWFGDSVLNYYYGGQYYGVYLLKLAYVPVSQAYNLFRMMIGAFAFVLPFSLVYHMLEDRLSGTKGRKGMAAAGGLLSAAAVSLAGNLHYVIYHLLGPILKPSGWEDYWFPSSTRYIGHNPLTEDQCIHEFPSYSFILGDVHAHMINVMFVLTVIGVLYAWVRMVRKEEKGEHFLIRNMTDGPMLLVGFLIGVFHWTNYWDFIIYFTAALFCIFSVSMYRYGYKVKKVAAAAAIHIVELFVVQMLVSLPFTLQFDSMAQGIGISRYHTALYQLAVLWALPTAIFVFFTGEVLFYHIKENRQFRENLFVTFFRLVPQADRFAIILGTCAWGLILIPELVYVKDIYEDGYARSNTMFKLTYQAYIFYGILLGYALIRLLVTGRNAAKKAAAVLLLAAFALTLGYLPYSVKEWFGNIGDHSRYEGLDATAFLESTYPEDAAAIRWMDEHIEGQPLILEVYGDSYTDDCRVSAMTGLPTVEGWYVHEWLWRNDTLELNQRRADIDAIYDGATYLEQYTEGGAENLTFEQRLSAVQSLVKKYGIEYIFVGSRERLCYDNLNESVLQSLGSVVYQNGSTYVVQVNG